MGGLASRQEQGWTINQRFEAQPGPARLSDLIAPLWVLPRHRHQGDWASVFGGDIHRHIVFSLHFLNHRAALANQHAHLIAGHLRTRHHGRG